MGMAREMTEAKVVGDGGEGSDGGGRLGGDTDKWMRDV